MASHSQPRAPGQDKKKRKDAGAEKHVLSLADQMEQSHEALPPKRRHPRNRNRQQATDEVLIGCISDFRSFSGNLLLWYVGLPSVLIHLYRPIS